MSIPSAVTVLAFEGVRRVLDLRSVSDAEHKDLRTGSVDPGLMTLVS